MAHPKKNTQSIQIRLTTEQADILRKTALLLGCTYAGEPSISLLNQRMADFLLYGVDSPKQ